uniref:Aminopeptidase N-like N-terminal domain-containing protein n=1 Tax=Anas zonorhyncha TaxID=75864 RepID=A0A8B9U7R0_9AVES
SAPRKPHKLQERLRRPDGGESPRPPPTPLPTPSRPPPIPVRGSFPGGAAGGEGDAAPRGGGEGVSERRCAPPPPGREPPSPAPGRGAPPPRSLPCLRGPLGGRRPRGRRGRRCRDGPGGEAGEAAARHPHDDRGGGRPAERQPGAAAGPLGRGCGAETPHDGAAHRRAQAPGAGLRRLHPGAAGRDHGGRAAQRPLRGVRLLPPWARPRLPRHLRPLHYNLMLSAFMENFTFCGEVNVQLEVRNASRYIVLHAHRMHIEAVRVAEDKLAGAVRVARSFLYPQTQVLVVVLNRSLEVQRSYNLKIIYNALIENELLGFFRSSYVLHGERRFLGVTQFSPTHARKAFPCFDEPIYKATFKISIRHQATYISLSNMPVETSVFEEDGWVTDHFSQTPLMSTYYLAWAVCNFTYRETVTKSGVVLTNLTKLLWSRVDKLSKE